MNIIPRRIRRTISKWVYDRYYRSTVEFETCVYSGMLYTTDGTYIKMAEYAEEGVLFLAMPDGTFLKQKPPTVAMWVEV